MELINDFYNLTLYLGRPAGVGYMIYGIVAQEPAAFIEGMLSSLTFDHLYRKNKELKNSNHKPSQVNRS